MTFLPSQTDPGSPQVQQQKPTVCVLDASSYVGFWILKGLVNRGYWVHAAVQKNGNREIISKVKEMSLFQKRLKVFIVDVLDYHSITEALEDCSALFCSLDSPDSYDDLTVDLEVRGAINVVEACAQVHSVEKMVFSSSLAAAIWRENIGLVKEVDEKSWSDPELCKRLKLWYPLAKTLSERASWALAMDRMVNMVSINAGLVLGPGIALLNPRPTMSFLKGAAQMCENGVLASVDVEFLADVHIRALEDQYSSGRYFCFTEVLSTEKDCIRLGQRLNTLISIPARYECKNNIIYEERLSNKKLKKLVEVAA
ncbi:cinnamoyl-CoA reductase-like SNL6 [Aristolochia californica]|uniref:cinnamoyl-CoA reductase-like SNL6 n=1 Tax=Aristolochia californica TaxID=171875 RepID=UPI0035D984A7